MKTVGPSTLLPNPFFGFNPQSRQAFTQELDQVMENLERHMERLMQEMQPPPSILSFTNPEDGPRTGHPDRQARRAAAQADLNGRAQDAIEALYAPGFASRDALVVILDDLLEASALLPQVSDLTIFVEQNRIRDLRNALASGEQLRRF